MARAFIAIGIDKDDELVAARITDGSQLVFLATHLGMAIRFDECDVRSMGRPAYGVRGMRSPRTIRGWNGNYSQGTCTGRLSHSLGNGERLWQAHDVDQYRLQTRGGKGVKNMAVTPRIGRVNTIQLVDDTQRTMVISQFGKIIRCDTKTIRAAGRATQGVRILTLEPERQGRRGGHHSPEELKDDEPTLLANRTVVGCQRIDAAL